MGSSFSKLLRELRNNRGYSVNQLAEKTGVSAAHISRIENELRSAPSPKTIEKLSKVLGNYDNLMSAAGYIDNINNTKPQSGDDSLEIQFPRISRVLRRNGKKITPEDEKLIAKIIEAAVEDKD